MRVGRSVRRHRVAKGISQEDLAHRCELDRTYVSGIERGLRNPTVVVLEAIAGVLGIEAAALLEPDAGEPEAHANLTRKGRRRHERR